MAGHAQKKVRAPQLPRGHVKLCEVCRECWAPLADVGQAVAMTMPMLRSRSWPSNLPAAWTLQYQVLTPLVTTLSFPPSMDADAVATGNFRILKAKVHVKCVRHRCPGTLGRVHARGRGNVAAQIMRCYVNAVDVATTTKHVPCNQPWAMALKCLKMCAKSRTTKACERHWLLIRSRCYIIENAHEREMRATAIGSYWKGWPWKMLTQLLI